MWTTPSMPYVIFARIFYVCIFATSKQKVLLYSRACVCVYRMNSNVISWSMWNYDLVEVLSNQSLADVLANFHFTHVAFLKLVNKIIIIDFYKLILFTSYCMHVCCTLVFFRILLLSVTSLPTPLLGMCLDFNEWIEIMHSLTFERVKNGNEDPFVKIILLPWN